MIKDIHSSNCTQCKIREQFYAEFNSDCKKNVPYLGIVSYINYYIFMNLSSEESKKFLKDGKNVCLFQLKNEWSFKEGMQKRIDQKKELIEQYFKEDNEQQLTSLKEKEGPEMPLYSPEHTSNLITIKKSESFTESSPEDTVSSNSLKKTKDIYKRKLKRKSRSKKKVGAHVLGKGRKILCLKRKAKLKDIAGEEAAKEPKLGTLKRKRFNFSKLKQSGVYEDDLFEETKLKCLRLAGNKELSNEKDTIKTPRWSLPISPIEPSQSPSFEDCFSPSEFQSIRKGAEVYQYRRSKRQKKQTSKKGKDLDTQTKTDPDTDKTLQSVCKILEEMGKKDSDGDSDKDDYFTDEEG
ncbi:uncharacterized protein LOC129960939 isoform X1 [Argiope bruennichi]|uniref:Uncharacterized protein n=1 Tax=Argiope bruennichi TaxID=94029 RepID=A0A8T0FTR9_ARGBR|nr:uncharacterized protein LOC129960939 isoform X1 [Argiope bruennichi]XP_055930679.1 uncharacterized protein LOC129960939 isoform X1 [Argiope bruennichi]XP_055930688.1 uncharacterized protein LOC129960939 isoform X1 [Argiope bruennichi]KAF8794547.1 hypothetical protein HNY73_002521 [Argiope bruennichi]